MTCCVIYSVQPRFYYVINLIMKCAMWIHSSYGLTVKVKCKSLLKCHQWKDKINCSHILINIQMDGSFCLSILSSTHIRPKHLPGTDFQRELELFILTTKFILFLKHIIEEFFVLNIWMFHRSFYIISK